MARARPAAAALALAALCCLAATASAENFRTKRKDSTRKCHSEWQLVMCGDIPLDSPAAREACCAQYEKPPRAEKRRADGGRAGKARAAPGGAAAAAPQAAAGAAAPPPPAAAAALVAPRAGAGYGGGFAGPEPVPEEPEEPEGLPAAPYADVPRPDLPAFAYGPEGAENATAPAAPEFLFGECTRRAVARVPTFAPDANGTILTEVQAQPVPLLAPHIIARVKKAALASRAPTQAAAKLLARSAARFAAPSAAARAKQTGPVFVHPGGYVGAGELALMAERLAAGVQPQVAANESFITGRGVPAKYYAPNGWFNPTDVPAEGYGGPFPMAVMEADYGGWNVDNRTCPKNYPLGAPVHVCGHVAFAEMDAQAAYKQAMAYAITKDDRHAKNAMKIVTAWAKTNKKFGLKSKNGPLEAAWGAASMARAMELLRATWPGFSNRHLSTFLEWVDAALMPQMDYYADVITPNALVLGRRALYGNWHASVADAMMSVGVLADDRDRYEKGLALYRVTVKEYFKWGRGYEAGRVLGEATETLRDVYHTLFGLGSLMQAAETAWGQNEDAFAESGHVLAAAMELHARIINAKLAEDESMLPDGFKFFESMPPPPENCTWRWDIESQRWSSFDAATKGKCSELDDGFKYLLGVKYLPNGFELGYNHFAGRLGMNLPETAKLLAQNPVDWYEFCWGLSTITHADSAKELWRAGVKRAALCGGKRAAVKAARDLGRTGRARRGRTAADPLADADEITRIRGTLSGEQILKGSLPFAAGGPGPVLTVIAPGAAGPTPLVPPPSAAAAASPGAPPRPVEPAALEVASLVPTRRERRAARRAQRAAAQAKGLPIGGEPTGAGGAPGAAAAGPAAAGADAAAAAGSQSAEF
ncbi:hypothetical protein Rsub_00690 [Raphidocelis subcapitata]|uniref:Alginate lyase domain-containing protein n=1 Tax=Raphidocelis subcapitata TaxID=307507 RepID=A0A2V0NKV7_9CHLO|nr:hypothetical protein Rsub_00690 [Raphidocelis subcapitata]|eukprot:GBF87978.1 hypothetical protein Rsub_00690 [Raphidocelis subcapitata]